MQEALGSTPGQGDLQRVYNIQLPLHYPSKCVGSEIHSSSLSPSGQLDKQCFSEMVPSIGKIKIQLVKYRYMHISAFG